MVDSTNARSNGVLSAITKNTILAIISISVNLIELGCILYCVETSNPTESLYIFCEFTTLLNALFTFLCIVLSYKFFDKQYYILCGWIDKCLRSCIKSMVIQKPESSKTEADAEYEPLV